MEDQIQPNTLNASKSSLKTVMTALFIEIGMVGVVIGLGVFALVYFNIISLGSTNLLSEDSDSQEPDIAEPIVEGGLSEVVSDIFPFAPCSVGDVEQCLSGEVITGEDDFYGIGYDNLPIGAEIQSPTNGAVERITQEEGLITVVIVDELGIQEWILSFRGEVFVSEGERIIESPKVIGDINEELEDSGYILTVSSRSRISNQYARIGISEYDGSYVYDRSYE